MLKSKDGKVVKDLTQYDPEQWVSIQEALKLLPDLLVERTWEDWRSKNRDSGSELGPQNRTFGVRCIKTKIKWLIRYENGLPWEEQIPQEPQQAAIITPIRKRRNS
mgnify:FL=1